MPREVVQVLDARVGDLKVTRGEGELTRRGDLVEARVRVRVRVRFGFGLGLRVRVRVEG